MCDSNEFKNCHVFVSMHVSRAYKYKAASVILSVLFKTVSHSCYDNFLTTGTVTLMNSFTGVEEIPPSGFPTEPTLDFNTDPYPTASTCGVELTLPSIYDR